MSWLSTNRRACSIASASPEQDNPTNLTKCPSQPTKYARYSVTAAPLADGLRVIKRFSGTSGNGHALNCRGQREENVMPVLILWAVPAVIFVGGVGYFLIHATH
jgi:hypothetical protein